MLTFWDLKFSRISVWEILARYFKSRKTCLSKTIDCTALHASLFGFNLNFLRALLLVIFGWVHLWNLEQLDHLCFFWMWKRILHHFSLSSVSSPSHVETASQRWLMIDLIHQFNSNTRNDLFFAADTKFFLMLLQKYKKSIWCIVSFLFSLVCFLICECLSVVLWSTVTPFVLKNLSPFINLIFYILLELLASVSCVMVIASILLVIWTMKQYVKYLALRPGLWNLPFPPRRHEPSSFNWFNIELLSLQYLSWTTPAKYRLWNL